jgi:uncharacterized damage-inducible protein DinB
LESLAHLQHLFAYEEWANRESLAALERAGAPPDGAVRLLAHVVGAGFLWLSRLRREPSPLPVWPELTLADCSRRMDELGAAWRTYLDSLAPQDPERSVAYRNSKGEPWTTRVGSILTHVALHGSYHRGQIAAEMRRAGHEPAYTDYVHAVREELV